MSAQPTKKDVERWQLQRFLAATAEFPSSEVLDSEQPDFIIRTPARRTGIELTQLFRRPREGEAPLQEGEALRRRICELAQNRFELGGGPYHQVYVTFSSSVRVRGKRRVALADAIARLVRRLDVAPGESCEIECDWLNRDLFPDEIVQVRAWRPPQEIRCVWQPSEAGWVAPCDREFLEDAIARKERLLEKYLCRTDRVWLLLVADAFGIASTFDLPEVQDFAPFATGFERVYFFENFSRQAVLLPTVVQHGVT